MFKTQVPLIACLCDCKCYSPLNKSVEY